MNAKAKPLHGLVLIGGKSSRMGSDKGHMIYDHTTKVCEGERIARILRGVCARVFISSRMDQEIRFPCEEPPILDTYEGSGPGVGILTAAGLFPDVAWFVMACDFPLVDISTVQPLISEWERSRLSIAYRHADVIEPLLTIWEKPAISELQRGFARADFSPRRALERTLTSRGLKTLSPCDSSRLLNVNCPTDLPAECRH